MKRIPLLAVAAGSLVLTACGPAPVVVTAEIQVTDPVTNETVTRQLADLVVQLLPYDRDEVFDSLAQAAAAPEPQIPAELLASQQATADAQREWRELDSRWTTLRDTLQQISEEMDQYSPAEGQYRLLFQDFQDMEAQYVQVEREKDRAFALFDSLSQANIERAQEFRVQYDEWADEAFADANDLFTARIRASGLDAAVDTTDASGVADFEVSPGQYWVFARYEEPYSELYWNIPITAVRGEPTQLTLNRANAEERPRF